MTIYSGLCSSLCGHPDCVPTLLRLLVSIQNARCLRRATQEALLVFVGCDQALARCEGRRTAPDSAFDRLHILLIFATWWYDEIVECSIVEMWKAKSALDGVCTAGSRNMHRSKEGIYHIHQQKLSHQMTPKNEVESGITFHEAGGTDQ